MAHFGRSDPIRWTIVWLAAGAIAIGVTLMSVPRDITSTPVFRNLHQIPMAAWGGIWAGIGVLAFITAISVWRYVLVPIVGIVMLMLFWAAAQATAAADQHGDGAIGAVLWVWFAGLVWFAALRAARTPHLRSEPE